MDRRSFLTSSSVLLSGLSLGSLVTNAYAQNNNLNIMSKLNTQLQFDTQNPLLLNFNENSLGMSPKAKQAVIDALPATFRYPDSARAALQSALGQAFKLTDKHIVLGNGSSETIRSIVAYIAHKGMTKKKSVQVIVPDPTFDYAEIYAKTLDVEVVKIPVTETMRFDIDAMQKKTKDFDGISIVYLCNPNNPTATLTPTKTIADWVKAESENVFFIIDEAYAEFAAAPEFVSAVSLVELGYKNLAVTRTFSKIYALAGLRLGYGIADPEIISEVEKYNSLDNINMAGAVAALASLQDTAFVEYSRQSINTSRQMVIDALTELNIEYAPSSANFIFHKVKGDVKTYQNRMREAYILVGREFPPAFGWSRLTLGTPEEMRYFVATLKAFRTKGWI